MDKKSQPIYYVITEGTLYHPSNMFAHRILRVFACDMEDVASLYDEHVSPLYNTGQYRNVTSMIFIREPANFLQEKAEFV